MSYIESSLVDGEAICENFSVHWFSYLGCFFGVVFSLLFFYLSFVDLQYLNAMACYILSGSSLVVALMKLLRIKFQEQGVTTRRVVLKKGIISRHTEEMKLTSIETVEIKQSVFGRIFNSGLIKVTGRGLSDLLLRDIKNPMHVKRIVETAISKAEY